MQHLTAVVHWSRCSVDAGLLTLYKTYPGADAVALAKDGWFFLPSQTLVDEAVDS